MSKTIPKSVAELRAIIADPDQPIGVRQAAERRLRKLSAEARAARRPQMRIPRGLEVA